MTFTIKQEKIDNYHIEICQEKFENTFHVVMSKTYDDELYHEKSDLIYATYSKALSRYNYLKRKINRNEVE